MVTLRRLTSSRTGQDSLFDPIELLGNGFHGGVSKLEMYKKRVCKSPGMEANMEDPTQLLPVIDFGRTRNARFFRVFSED